MSVTAPLDKRGQYIPTRKRELFTSLLADLGLSCTADAPAGRFYEILVALIHHEFLRDLELLHDAYHVVDPDEPHSPEPQAMEAAYATVSESLERVLRSANFVEVDPAMLHLAETEQGRIRMRLRNAVTDFRAVRLFRRGEHTETFVRKSLYGLRKHVETLTIFDEVVLLAAVNPDQPVVSTHRGRRRRSKFLARHGAVMIKYFHDIAVADLDALYPGAQVMLSLGDQLSLGVPAVVAGVPLAIKLAPAVLVLFGLLRFYFGGQPPGAGNLGEALVVAGGLIALGGFLSSQWTKFQRRALLHQREVNEMIYFHNITNNVGIFDHIIRNAEEQDCKEAFLAYFMLLTAAAPLTQAELDVRVEQWLKTRLGLEVDFEVDDALRKLEAYGLLIHQGENLSVRPLPEALAVLDRRWDDIFVCTGPAGAAASGIAPAVSTPPAQ